MDERRRLFIGGAWAEPMSSEAIAVISPHTEEAIATVAAADPDDVDRAVTAARAAYDEGPWPSPPRRHGATRMPASDHRPHRLTPTIDTRGI